jgi:hypothetical protein
MTAAQGAKILCLHSNKLSEYLGGVYRIPCALVFHIEALNLLDDATREQVFKKRLERKTHGAV